MCIHKWRCVDPWVTIVGLTFMQPTYRGKGHLHGHVLLLHLHRKMTTHQKSYKSSHHQQHVNSIIRWLVSPLPRIVLSVILLSTGRDFRPPAFPARLHPGLAHFSHSCTSPIRITPHLSARPSSILHPPGDMSWQRQCNANNLGLRCNLKFQPGAGCTKCGPQVDHRYAMALTP